MLTRQSHSPMQDKTVLQQLHLQPRSVRQRVENCQLLEQYNLGYQDDVFDQISPIKRKVGLLTTSSSSSSEDSFSVTSSSSSTGPILSWPVPRSSTPMKQTTPVSKLASFQHCAYLHKRLKKKRTLGRRVDRTKSNKMSWRGDRDKQFKEMVDQVTAVTVGEDSLMTEDVSGEEVESYFSEDE